MTLMRSLIEPVEIDPEGPRACFCVEVRGNLNALIADTQTGLHSGVHVVAREGFEPPTQGL